MIFVFRGHEINQNTTRVEAVGGEKKNSNLYFMRGTKKWFTYEKSMTERGIKKTSLFSLETSS